MALRKENKPISIKAISQRENLSPIFLEQIFTKLKKAGIAESIRGTAGGFRLTRQPEQITILDILEAVEEGIQLTPCSTGKAESCTREDFCSVNRFWEDLEDEFKAFLASKDIRMIMEQYKKEP